MAQAVQAAAAAVSAWVANGAIALGASKAVATVIAVAASYATTIGLNLAITVGLNALAGMPNSEAGKQAIQNAIPARQRGYGRARISGPGHACLEVTDQLLNRIIPLHHGKISGFVQYYLNDDLVTLTGNYVNDLGDGTYGDDSILLLTRTGLAVETAYTEAIAAMPGVWTSAHRGDSIASLYLQCDQAPSKDQAKRYPNGAPQPSVVADLSPVWDWRDGGQDPNDPDTWLVSYNHIVNLRDYLTTAVTDGGMGFDHDARIAPEIDYWTDAADICDEAVPLKAGGTTPRYHGGGYYYFTNTPSDVVTRLLESCDGWLTTSRNGAFRVFAGKYYTPTVTLDDDAITGYQLQRYPEDETAVNALTITFNDPDHAYTEVETDQWRDEDDILARGIERVGSLNLPWVQVNSTARRLAKRAVSRLNVARGTITCNLAGLQAIGERYLRVQISEIDFLSDCVVEVVALRIDIAAMQVVINFNIADPNIDAWNAATEEGDGPATESRVPGEALTAPTVDAVAAVFDVSGVRLTIDTTGPVRNDLTWFARWRVNGGIAWVEGMFNDVDPTAAVELQTGYVPAEETIEVETAYSTSAGTLSPWSAPYDVSTVSGDPGPVETPAIFAPPAVLTASGAEVWIAATGLDADWGGAFVWVSFDDPSSSGPNYEKVGTITARARYGEITNTLPITSDPDSTSTLGVDLTASQGVLEDSTQAGANALQTLFLVGTELMAYQFADVLGAYEFGLQYIRRGALGTAIGDHAIGDTFVRLDSAIAKIPYLSSQAGEPMLIKLQSFNLLGREVQDLNECVPYNFTPAAIPAPPPGATAWTLAGTTLVQGEFSVAAIVITGACDNPDATQMQFYIRVDGSTGAFAANGVVSRDSTRIEITSVTSGTAYEIGVTYFVGGIEGELLTIGTATAGITSVPGGGIADGTVLLTSDTPGAVSFTFPSGVLFADIEIWGPGGNSAGATNTGSEKEPVYVPNAGGGAGGYMKKHSAIVDGSTLAGVVGNWSGSIASSISSPFVATANSGGDAAGEATPGTGGTASGGDTNTTGRAGGLTNIWDGGGTAPANVDQTTPFANGTLPGGGAPGGFGNPATGRIKITARTS